MLKQILKACLASAVLIGMSAPVMAQDITVNASLKEYFGQWDTGVENTDARLHNAGEANLSVTGTMGPITGYMQIEFDDDKQGLYNSEKNKFNDDSQRWVKYTNGGLSVKIGTILNAETLGYTLLGGTGTFNLFYQGATPAAAISGGYIESDGIRVGYKMDAADIGITVYDTVKQVNAYKYSAAIYGSTIQTGLLKGGQVTQLSANGMVGPVVWSGAYTLTKSDDPDVTSDTAQNGTLLKLGALVFLAEKGAMGIALDYGSAKASINDADYEGAETSLQFFIQAGPGKVKLTYTTGEGKYDGESQGKSVWTNFVYDIPLDKSVGARICYLSWGMTPEGEDTTTTTFVGGGLYANF